MIFNYDVRIHTTTDKLTVTYKAATIDDAKTQALKDYPHGKIQFVVIGDSLS
jgi:hypothetical protein